MSIEKKHILVLRSNGALELIPAEDDVFVQSRGILGGCYIKCVNTCIPGLVMLIDEEGKLKGLPTNDRATALYPNRFDYIVGDVVFVNVQGEDFVPLKDSGYVEAVLGKVI